MFFKKEKIGSKRIITIFGLKLCYNKAKKFKFKQINTNGLNNEIRTPKIIVSLTSFPDRIPSLHKNLSSLLSQTVKPDMLILWLAEEQFPNKEQDLPVEILRLKNFGLTIRWCKNLRSYKKLIPTIQEFPEDIIITADDDVFYHPEMIERLYKSYLKYPNHIHCHKTKKITFKNNEIKTKQKKCYKYPSFGNILVGVGGVLYPPHSLFKDITNEELFKKLAPTNDDLWFWAAAVLNNTRIMKVKKNIDEPIIIEETYSTPSLAEINNHGEKLFYIQLENILNHYKDLKAKILSDIKK